MRGRKPTPKAILEARGSRDALARRKGEPVAAGPVGGPPRWMTHSQRAIWRAAVASAPGGVLGRIDASVLTVWVVACDLHRKAVAEVERLGAVVAAPKTHVSMQNPWLAIQNRQAMLMLKAAAELGFSPTARGRVHALPAVAPEDEAERAMSERFGVRSELRAVG